MLYFRFVPIVAASAAVVALSGCGGGGGGSPIGPAPGPTATAVASPTASPPVILVAGSQRMFSGTDSSTHTYASPSANQSNYTAASTFTSTTTVNTAAAGAPAAFDLNTVVDYTITQPATTGTQTLGTTTDTYENQTMSGSSTTITQTGSKETITANDVTGNDAGGGPYTVTTNDATSYASPFIANVFPLQTGYSITEPLARTMSETQSDTNAAGTAPSTNFVASQTETFANDGSFTIDPRNDANGTVFDEVENANGSGSNTQTNGSYVETIGVPAMNGSAYTIPVSVANSGTTTPYQAADWYPGAAAAVSPLELETLTVKGPPSTLPSGCAGALVESNVVEVDTNTTTLNIFGSYQVETQQAYNANGINDCLLRTTTTHDYSVTTGALTQTVVDNFAQILTSVGTASKARIPQLRRK